MKLSSFLLPAAFGLASAKSPEVEAYLLRSWRPSQSTSTPSIPAHVAQAILQQRLGAGGRLSNTLTEDDYETIVQFGKLTPELFTDVSEDAPQQLVVILKNADQDRLKDLKKALSSIEPTFTTTHLTHLPSSYLSSSAQSQCAIEDAINPDKNKCWQSKVQYLEYDVSKDSKVSTVLSRSIAKLQALAKSQEPARVEDIKSKMETIVVILPTSSTPDSADELRRRDFFQAEQSMDEEVVTASSPSGSSISSDQSFKTHLFAAEKLGPIPSCFASQSACDVATGNCSGHGTCENKYDKDSTACFSCRCLSTLEPGEDGAKQIHHWGGSACQKIDISTPFWLFAGFTIFMVSAVGFSISLLFGVGEEKLPGVIGAGVSRGAK